MYQYMLSIKLEVRPKLFLIKVGLWPHFRIARENN